VFNQFQNRVLELDVDHHIGEVLTQDAMEAEKRALLLGKERNYYGTDGSTSKEEYEKKNKEVKEKKNEKYKDAEQFFEASLKKAIKWKNQSQAARSSVSLGIAQGQRKFSRKVEHILLHPENQRSSSKKASKSKRSEPDTLDVKFGISNTELR